MLRDCFVLSSRFMEHGAMVVLLVYCMEYCQTTTFVKKKAAFFSLPCVYILASDIGQWRSLGSPYLFLVGDFYIFSGISCIEHFY